MSHPKNKNEQTQSEESTDFFEMAEYFLQVHKSIVTSTPSPKRRSNNG